MIPAPFEIFEADFPYGNVCYPRPCVILSRMIGARLSAMPISSALELCKGLPLHFTIEKSDPDFGQTGLARTSYCAGEHIRELQAHDLIRKRGRLEGDLLKRFQKWIA